MKKAIAVFLLLLMAVNLAGFYGYFVLRMKEIHTEAREALKRLPETSLQRFEFSTAEYRSIRVEDHEIRVNGKMYDIARTERTADAVVVWALHDEAEDDLFAFINKVMDNAAQDDHQAPKDFTQFLSLQFLLPGAALPTSAAADRASHHTAWMSFNAQARPDGACKPPRV